VATQKYRLNVLPDVILGVAGELGFLGPAEVEEGLADVLLYIGGDGTGAVVVFVVAFAGIGGDKTGLDGPFYTGRHVKVQLLQSDGHTAWLIIAVRRTGVALHLGMVEVNTRDDVDVVRGVTAEDGAQTVCTEGTGGAVAYDVGLGFLAEKLFFCLWGLFFHSLSVIVMMVQRYALFST